MGLRMIGPWPKMAIVSPPCSWTRRSAPQAVPVPREMAAPVTKESESGSGTSVDTGTFMYFAWRCRLNVRFARKRTRLSVLVAHLYNAGASCGSSH
jgi:hypothetical protein